MLNLNLIKKCLFIFLFVFNGGLLANTVYIVPFGGSEGEALFDIEIRDECMKVFSDLKNAFNKLNYQVQTTLLEEKLDDVSLILSFDFYSSDVLERLKQYPKDTCILLIWEPPTVRRDTYVRSFHESFGKVYSMIDLIIDNQRYFKFYFPQPRLQMISELIPFKDKKLCTLIAGNKGSNAKNELYSKRRETIDFFEAQRGNDFDFYGIGWSPKYKNYKGRIKTKKDVLKKYKFCICYENIAGLNGYITEKIFDCFVAGCVPIYWGSYNITQYIPADCFIDRRYFASNQELYDYLKTIDTQEYERYLNNIERFLRSDAAFLFSSEFFADTMIRILEPNYDMNLVFSKEQQEKIIKACQLYTLRH
jgi:alpha(1,3/1,4) fucosyltransferase